MKYIVIVYICVHDCSEAPIFARVKNTQKLDAVQKMQRGI